MKCSSVFMSGVRELDVNYFCCKNKRYVHFVIRITRNKVYKAQVLYMQNIGLLICFIDILICLKSGSLLKKASLFFFLLGYICFKRFQSKPFKNDKKWF